MSSTSSAGSAAFPSGSNGPEDSAPSPSVRSNPTAAPSSPDTGPASPVTPTLELFPESKASTSSAEASPVSLRALQEADAEALMSAGYGPRSLKLFEHIAPPGSWQRTLSDSLASDLMDCRGCAGHFETSVIQSGPSSSALTMWVLHTCDDESGLLPTPTGTSYGTTNNGQRGDGSTYRTAGTPSLETMARKGLWPTPRASDAHFGVSLTDAVRADGGTGRIRGEQKLSARAHWPTPTAVTHRQGTPRMADWGGSGSRAKLDQLTSREESRGALNPTWVEWLMGFPLGWTVCERSATRSSRKSRKSSGEPS